MLLDYLVGDPLHALLAEARPANKHGVVPICAGRKDVAVVQLSPFQDLDVAVRGMVLGPDADEDRQHQCSPPRKC